VSTLDIGSEPLRWIGWIFAALLLVGWVAAELPPVVSPAESMAPDLWRRTRDGWERAEWLRPEPAPAPLWLHPAVLATFQITVSVAGLPVLSHRRLRALDSSSILGQVPRPHLSGMVVGESERPPITTHSLDHGAAT
jgi:hypothetical protein